MNHNSFANRAKTLFKYNPFRRYTRNITSSLQQPNTVASSKITPGIDRRRRLASNIRVVTDIDDTVKSSGGKPTCHIRLALL